MRADAAKREPKIQANVMAGLYQWQREHLRGSPADPGAAEFILHDGPPFANGCVIHGGLAADPKGSAARPCPDFLEKGDRID